MLGGMGAVGAFNKPVSPFKQRGQLRIHHPPWCLLWRGKHIKRLPLASLSLCPSSPPTLSLYSLHPASLLSPPFPFSLFLSYSPLQTIPHPPCVFLNNMSLFSLFPPSNAPLCLWVRLFITGWILVESQKAGDKWWSPLGGSARPPRAGFPSKPARREEWDEIK